MHYKGKHCRHVHASTFNLNDNIITSNFQAPVSDALEKGITVLDSGCGPATWTFEMGEAWPNSTFHGIDASCVFPENIKPANVEFVISNIAKEIPYPDNTFDYIHQRLLLLGLTNADWENVRHKISKYNIKLIIIFHRH